VLVVIITKGASTSGMLTEATEAVGSTANVYLDAKGAKRGGGRFFREKCHENKSAIF